MDKTAFGRAETSALMKVEKRDGRVMYYRVADDTHVEISSEEYYKEGGA